MDLPELLTVLDLKTFTAFDFETTGLDPGKDKAIEFAAVRFTNGQIEDTFRTFINPRIEIPPFITSLTGITDEMVSGAPPEEEVVKDITDFLGSDPLVAHNIEFDLGFLNSLRSRYPGDVNEISNLTYDTLFLARSFLFFLSHHRLGSVSAYFGHAGEEEHRALGDAISVGRILVHLVQEACSYPLPVIQRILSVLKDSPSSGRALFVNVANYLVRHSMLHRGMVESKIEKNLESNVFAWRGLSTDLPSSAEEVFGESGPFSQMAGNGRSMGEFFEVRPGQIQYSDFVHEVFNQISVGVCEAGTGLGKSLAYLFPALKHSVKGEGPTVVSCYTKPLQDQLFYQEMPKLAKALDISFTATLLKGRQNYLCKTRLEWLIEEAAGLLSPVEAQFLVPIIVWLNWTKTGDFDECSGFLNRRSMRVRELIQSDTGFCTRVTCGRQKGCFLGPIRDESRKANIVVVNHSLLLSELLNPGILPAFRRVIVDEAHNLAQVAYDRFRVTIHHRGIKSKLMAADRTSRRSLRLKKQMDSVGRLHPRVAEQFHGVMDSVQNILKASERFFSKLSAAHARNYRDASRFDERIRYRSFETHFGSTAREVITLVKQAKSATEEVNSLVQTVGKLQEGSVGTSTIVTLQRLKDSFEEILSSITATMLDQKTDWVYWEEGRFDNGELVLSLNGVPVDVGKHLRDTMFKPLDSVVLTSATLTVEEGFEYVCSRLGISEITDKPIRTGAFLSSFHYDEQCRYFQYAGDFSPNSVEFPKLVADTIAHIHRKWKKRTMVLFTSWRLLDRCHQEVLMDGAVGGTDLFVQHFGSSRTVLLQRFKASAVGVLLGTRSFWEGVDLPAELLEILVVTKLPFDVPKDPVVEAYGERILQNGGNPFLGHSVPEAIMKLRQGFGRLIRSTYDEGVFINMDNRVVRRQYGLHFQKAIPVKMELFRDPGEI